VINGIIRQPLFLKAIKEAVDVARLKVAYGSSPIIRERGKSLGFGDASGSVGFGAIPDEPSVTVD